MALTARISVWVMRVIGMAASAYIGVLAAGNIPNALSESGRVPGTHFANWAAAFVLSAGVGSASISSARPSARTRQERR